MGRAKRGAEPRRLQLAWVRGATGWISVNTLNGDGRSAICTQASYGPIDGVDGLGAALASGDAWRTGASQNLEYGIRVDEDVEWSVFTVEATGTKLGL